MIMTETVDLLFFDTFAHENSEELNLDLVQFPKPVYVTEVRIIPLGARVQADFPGGVRLGATNPSQFSIEFFVNDLGKPGASTFESLGGFDYNQNGCINLECATNEAVRKIPTDGLVLRGWYTTITLAVYGILTSNIAEQIIQPVVPPTIPPQTNPLPDVQQIIPVNTIENEWTQENMQPVSMEYAQQPHPVPYAAQTYAATEPFQQEYTDYYNEPPKDPRSYHNTPETDWDNKSRGRSIERDRDRDSRDRPREVERYQKTGSLEREHSRGENDRRDRDRDRHYSSRSHSQDRDRQSREFRETSRDRERDREWEHEHPQNFHPDKDWDRGDRDRDRDRDRNYKHQDNYRRTYGREEREDIRKRPRTPPINMSPKRPHTPHSHTERKELSPVEAENFSEEEFNADKQRKEWDGQNSNSSNNQVVHRKGSPKENQETQSPTNEEALHMDVEEFEPILSDEDILDDSEHFQDLDYDYTAYTNNDDLIKLFIPGTTLVRKYKKKPAFSLLDNKIEMDQFLKSAINISDDFFRSSITKYALKEFENLNTEIKEEFIHLCEKVMSTIGEAEHFHNIVKLYTLTKDSPTLKETHAELVNQIETITETLMDWLQIALDFEMANTQNQPAYKIRHIKCGVRLADWCCGSIEFMQLLWNQSYYIHDVLLSLYSREYMALSIKLMILHALDTYIIHKPAIERFAFFEKDGDVSKENGFNDAFSLNKQTGYKKLTEIICQNPSVRLKFSLQSILMKLNIYEVLYKLHASVAKLRLNNNTGGVGDNVDYIIKFLNQLLHMYQCGPFIVSQPKRFLPVSAQFEINRTEMKNVYINLFQMQNLLDCFVVLLTMPTTMNISSVKTPILEILSELVSTSDGLSYLYDNEETVNVLLKCLIQSQNNDEYSLSIPYLMEFKAHTLGLRIAYKLEAQYHIDYLLDIGEKCKFDCDAAEVIDQLHALYCLTFSNTGKIACSEVLSYQNNIKCLLQFLEIVNTKEKSDAQLTKIKKSPGIGYIIDLISFTIICNNFNVSFLENYSKQFLYIISQQDLFEPSVTVKINEFSPYVKPFESLTLVNYDNINPIVEMINRHIDAITSYPGQLIVCLRILQHLGISKYAVKTSIFENLLNNYLELKYKHVIIQLFSMDGVAILTKVLQKICEHYEQPTLHTTTFISNQSISIINTIQPCIDLLKQMLTYVIQCRNTNFKDLTSIPTLLQTYNLLRSFPNNSPAYNTARRLCEKIIDTLLVYTQPVSDEVNEKDSLSKTLWTLMCGEVIKYTNSAPYTFISGLLIFSELLPLPLPIQTREPLTTEEVSWAVNLRKLWSAHLHAYSSNIQELINRLCTSTHPPLLNLLRKVCIQLADLAANSAVMIARGILDTVHTGLSMEEDLEQPCSANSVRLLNLLACLVTHNSLKCAVLHLLYPNNPNISKVDEKYSNLLQIFAKIVNFNTSVNTHIQAQECILSIIQSLCDTEITLLQNSNDKSEISQDVYLANSLPTKECLFTFISMIIDHLMADNTFVTYLPILRTLMLLTEHDYGFYHLREHLNKKTEPFVNLLKKLVDSFSKDNEDYLSALNTLMEFLRISITPEEIAESMNLRTIKMSPGEIKALIGWKQENSEEDTTHPLYQIQEILKKTTEEDKTFDNYLLEGVTNVINTLTKEVNESKETYTEPLLPAPGSLLIQFAGRPIFTLSDVADEQLTSAYWLSAPTDEGNADIENVTCDLSEMCRLHLPSEVNLIREVEKLCRIYPSNNTEQDDSKVKGGDIQKDKNKKTFVTPMARRGFPRTIQARADLFRSRPPNTSRPPSLHVDDFVALETCGAQPTGPTGYNKISRELLATSRIARGTRGRSFITSERTAQYRQMSWWGAGMNRGPYQ